MLRCNEVVGLCASGAIRSAPWRTRIAYHVHLMMCRHCRRYVRELGLIASAVRELARQGPEGDERMERLIRSVLPDDGEPPG